jgi:hypothetical protein
MDTLAFGAAANALALGWLLTLPAVHRLARPARFTLAVAWILALGLGLNGLIRGGVAGELAEAKAYYLKAEGNMRRYLATNDPRHLTGPDIPYPNADALVERLARPKLRALMPVPLRTPLPLEPATPAGGSPFIENDARQADPKAPQRAGLSPATIPLDYAPSWGSHGAGGEGSPAQGEWKSRPVALTHPDGWLRFETAGQLGEPGLALELQDATSGAVLATVKPTRVPGDSWRAAYVPKPSVPFVVVARDQDPNRWLAFSGPAEMGPLSHWAWRANKHGVLIFTITAGVTLVLGLATLVPLRRRS